MTVSLAISGLGLMGQRHADVIEGMDDVELTGIADPGDEAATEAGRRGVKIHPTLAGLIAENKPDGVIISTPTILHIETAQVCLEHGIPMLIEKPISTDSVKASTLVEAAAKANVAILVGHHRRHNPLIAKAREIIGAGRLGEIRAVNGMCWFYKPDAYFEVGPWRKQRGAGPVTVNLSHDIDLMRYLCGEIESVFAIGAPSARGFENEDVACVALQFSGGAIGNITVSDSIAAPWSWEMTSGEHPVYPKTDGSCYFIGGAKASLSVPDLRLYSHGEGEPDWWSPMLVDRHSWEASEPLVNQIRHFCDVITGKSAPIISGAEGLKTLQVIEAIHASIKNGKSQRVG